MKIAEILAAFPSRSALVVGDICLDRWCTYDPATAEASLETGIPRIGVVATGITPGAGGTIASNLAELGVGRVVSRLWACRQMSLAVAGALAEGEAPEIAAALVKDVGTRLESEIIEVARMLTSTEPDPEGAGIARLLAQAVLHAPGFTLRGGTNEILRGIVARGLALR